MQMNKFEEKARDLLVEGSIVPADAEDSLFQVMVDSIYKSKKLIFRTKGGIPHLFIAFEVSAETLEDLFDKAFRVLKSYVPKATGTKNVPEQGSLFDVKGV